MSSLRCSSTTALVLAGILAGCGPGPARPPEPPRTVVTLTFDDSLADQYQVRDLLAEQGMRATFFVITGRLGEKGSLTLAQLRQLAQDGHEIAGHTVNHLDLTQLSPDEQRSEICGSRAALADAGFPVASFAYPFGKSDASTEQLVADCDYSSGRGVGGISVGRPCATCVPQEDLPPPDLFRIRTPGSVRPETTLADLQSWIERAEQADRGWVPLVIHHVCDGCATNAVSPQLLRDFFAWLAPRSDQGTVVWTMREAIEDER